MANREVRKSMFGGQRQSDTGCLCPCKLSEKPCKLSQKLCKLSKKSCTLWTDMQQ